MSITPLQEKHDSVIEQLIKVNENDLKSKTELVKQLIDISRNLVNQDLIKGVKSSELATYINAKLIEYEIKFPRNDNFYGLFNDSEKRSYGTNLISIISIRFI